MKCCICKKPIKKSENRTYWFTAGRKLYGCWKCNESGAVDTIIDKEKNETSDRERD